MIADSGGLPAARSGLLLGVLSPRTSLVGAGRDLNPQSQARKACSNHFLSPLLTTPDYCFMPPFFPFFLVLYRFVILDFANPPSIHFRQRADHERVSMFCVRHSRFLRLWHVVHT